MRCVAEKELSVVSQFRSSARQPFPYKAPPAVLVESLYVLHHEGRRTHTLNEIHEVEHVARSMVIRIHLSRYRESLAWRSSDDQVSRSWTRQVLVRKAKEVAGVHDPVPIEVWTRPSQPPEDHLVGCRRIRIQLIDPRGSEPCKCEADVHSASPCVERYEGAKRILAQGNITEIA
jgi:hypothetical protein